MHKVRAAINIVFMWFPLRVIFLAQAQKRCFAEAVDQTICAVQARAGFMYDGSVIKNAAYSGVLFLRMKAGPTFLLIPPDGFLPGHLHCYCRR
jgi:hypothetical protein